jgi:hypothetical protein
MPAHHRPSKSGGTKRPHESDGESDGESDPAAEDPQRRPGKSTCTCGAAGRKEKVDFCEPPFREFPNLGGRGMFVSAFFLSPCLVPSLFRLLSVVVVVIVSLSCRYPIIVGMSSR